MELRLAHSFSSLPVPALVPSVHLLSAKRTSWTHGQQRPRIAQERLSGLEVEHEASPPREMPPSKSLLDIVDAKGGLDVSDRPLRQKDAKPQRFFAGPAMQFQPSEDGAPPWESRTNQDVKVSAANPPASMASGWLLKHHDMGVETLPGDLMAAS
eukprot:s2732_g11.t1